MRRIPELVLARARLATPQDPFVLMVSGCMAGANRIWDDRELPPCAWVSALLNSPRVHAVPFCPEHLAKGTPRALSDIHGGDGFSVLDGEARVLTEDGEDWTADMVAASQVMLGRARASEVTLALLLDVSAACGSQVIYLGSRSSPEPVHQKGAGVAAATLMRGGVPVVCQRDFGSLRALFSALQIPWTGPDSQLDHHESAWVIENLG